MKKYYVNCVIYGSEDTAFATEGNRIVSTGKTDDILAGVTPLQEVVDLNGMFVVPGFIDSHMHLLELGHYLFNADLSGCRSNEDIRKELNAFCTRNPDAEWIIGRGYHEDTFTDHSVPDRQFLDSVSADKPAAITRACGHVMTVNTKALEAAGISGDLEVDGGRVTWSTGLVEENAIHLIHDAQPKHTPEMLMKYIETGSSYCNAKGITVAGSDDFLSVAKDSRLVQDVFEKMAYQGRMTVRVNEQCEFEDIKTFARFLDDGYTMDVGNDYFRIGPLKLITDGSLGARTAAMSKPYHDDPKTSGYMSMSDEDIEMFVKLANRFNMGTICHAIGDDAVQRVLDVFKDNVLPGNPLHHGLVHCQIMTRSQIDQVLRQKLSCYIQSQFIDYDASILAARAGKLLAKTSYPFRTLFEGTLTSNGSDGPVEMPDPLFGIQMAVTRKSVNHDASMTQDECMTVEQAIDSFTVCGAKQLFMEDRLGQIKEGYLADFAVIDQDIRKMDPEKISTAKIVMTVMDGEEVYAG